MVGGLEQSRRQKPGGRGGVVSCCASDVEEMPAPLWRFTAVQLLCRARPHPPLPQLCFLTCSSAHATAACAGVETENCTHWLVVMTPADKAMAP
jgi:hypothetical protein